MLALQVTGGLPGKNALVRNRQSHRVCNTGSSAGAHPAPTKADSMVLGTRGGQEEKPGGHGVTDGLVRRRRVWREQELWFVPKERQRGEALSVFTGKLLPCCRV